MKITIHTMSTKCQYRPTISTGNDPSPGRRSTHDIETRPSSIKTPTVTWTPWNPVSTKKVVPNRLVESVSPSSWKSVNSYTWPPTNVSPSIAVASSHRRIRPGSPRCAEESARTIVSELASSTNDDTDV